MAVQHPKDMVIGGHEQIGRVAKGGILGKPAGIGMTMPADEGQVSGMIAQVTRMTPNSNVCRKKPILVQHLYGPPVSNGIDF